MRRCARVGWLASLPLLPACVVPAGAQGQALPLDEVRRDVDVLLELYRFNLTADQLKTLPAAVGAFLESAGEAELGAQAAAAAPKVRQLREALIKGEAPETVNQLVADLAQLRQAAPPDPDQVQTAVREAVNPILDLLSAEQIARLAPLPDPRQLGGVLDELRVARQMQPDQWETWRDDLAARLGYDLAGGNQAEAQETGLEVTAFLNKAQALTDAEIQQQSTELLDGLATRVQSFGRKPTAEWQREQAAVTMLQLLHYPKLRILLEEFVRARTGAQG